MFRKAKKPFAQTHRDVHTDQQLVRSEIGEMQTMTSRTIFAAVMGVLSFFAAWLLISIALYVLAAVYVPSAGDAPPATTSAIETTAPDMGYIEYRDANYTLKKAYPDYPMLDDVYTRNSDNHDVGEPIIRNEYDSLYGSNSSSSGSGGLGASGSMADYIGEFTLGKLLLSLLAGFMVFSIIYAFMRKNLDVQNSTNNTEDINQYVGDMHIQQAHEVQSKYDWFPDVGAHAPIQVSSLISHMALSNKGLASVQMARRAESDILSPEGEILFRKGEVLLDEDGELIMDKKPMIDEPFMEELWDASFLPKNKSKALVRVKFDPTKISYNPGNEARSKLKDADTIADMINRYWTIPYYEPQRPAGAYIVDTEPVNTMVLAITRAGKGQLIIEPTLDMWTRETEPNNMVINDPKGELLQRFYVRGTVRGFQIVQFNLINAMKTDIYNPLGIAAEAAREGDFTKCAQYVKNIAEVFFPLDGGDDPVWPNAANNAFQRAAYGLIDYYLEEEKELRIKAEKTGLEPQTLETLVDNLWGKVTLYNCYQLFVQLTSKKLKNPSIEFKQRAKNGDFDALTPEENPDMLPPNRMPLTDDEFNEAKEKVVKVSELWEDKPESDVLTLFFNATSTLPMNEMRKLVANSNNALRAMAGAEKMLASVYGIAITAMSFFTDPTISTLTSGTPSQNVDLGGLSFPRRLGVRFSADFIKKYALLGLQARWESFEDKKFEKNLGKEFYHEDIISREGWAMYYFKGKFERDTAYVRLQVVNPFSGNLVKTFYFEFRKSYQKSLDGRYYMTDPVTGDKIVKNGILIELRQGKTATGEIRYKRAKTTFPQEKIVSVMDNPVKERVQTLAIIRTMVRYSEKPKMVFLVTPPHLMQYAKLILILITQLVNFNFDKSYMTKSNQKPLYKTRFMLDELGNLQSEGHGIANFQTMLSIGLGQDQQFTIILQTLQQLRDVYGESVDKIVQGNAQPLTAKIATPTGFKLMGDIRVGDKVLTPFGTVTTVTGVYDKGIRPVYRVGLRDGSETEACNEHLWKIDRWKSCYKLVDNIRVGLNNGKTCECVSEIINTLEMKSRMEKGRAISLPSIMPVAYPEADLPVDPYVMGVILGDCNIQKNGVVHLTSADADIVQAIRDRGYEVVHNSVNKDDIAYCINVMNDIMRHLGLAGKRSYEKSVPASYLQGSIEQRTALLRGLMDTAGSISVKSEIEFSSASEQLARDVQTLIRSLGGRVDVHTKTNITYTAPNQPTPKAARDAYRVQNVRLPDINPFSLPRKTARWKKRTDTSGNHVVAVEYVRDDVVRCIRVADERHLYLTDDFIPTHNTSNIIFLKSTDDSMLDTLQKMSGTCHKGYRDSKTVTRDLGKPIMANEGKISYTLTTREMPVISYNDMAYLPRNNAIVFRAGDPPIWNCNETILLMAYRLFKDTITQPGKEYTLQTIPTLSSALEFDVRKNQPDFIKMWEKRRDQAVMAQQAKQVYKDAYQYDDYAIDQLDQDVWSDDIMTIIADCLSGPEISTEIDEADGLDYNPMDDPFMEMHYENNDEQAVATAEAQSKVADNQVGRYANRMIARADLIRGKQINHTFDMDFIECFKDLRAYFFKDSKYFMERNGSLILASNGAVLIQKCDESDNLTNLIESSESPDAKVYAEPGAIEASGLVNYEIKPAFYHFLVSLPSWEDIADGRFEAAMTQCMTRDNGGE